MGAHPESGEAVRVLDGRYGPYVTDGTTNASVPKGLQVESLTMAAAVELLNARAGMAKSKKPMRGRRAPKAAPKPAARKPAAAKTAAAPKAAKKKAAKKKAAKKKAAKKAT